MQGIMEVANGLPKWRYGTTFTNRISEHVSEIGHDAPLRTTI